MGRGRSGRIPGAQATAPVQRSEPPVGIDERGFKSSDNSDFHDLYNGREYYQRQKLTDAERRAATNYVDNAQEGWTPYSHSQNLNHLMRENARKGLPITTGMNAKQLDTYNGMMSAMHNLGYNVNLTRYDHAGFVNTLLEKAGVRGADYERMDINTLRNMLVGTRYGEERLITTSYNNFKNAPQSSKDVFMNRAVRIEYRARASTKAMMPGDGPGGRMGEVVLAPSGGRENFRVVEVRYDNNVNIRRKGTRSVSKQKQLVFIVET